MLAKLGSQGQVTSIHQNLDIALVPLANNSSLLVTHPDESMELVDLTAPNAYALLQHHNPIGIRQ